MLEKKFSRLVIVMTLQMDDCLVIRVWVYLKKRRFFKVSITIYFALRTQFVFNIDFSSFYQGSTKGNMLDVDHLDIDPRDILVFIYQSGRRLVESGQKIAFERATSLSEPFATLSFCD